MRTITLQVPDELADQLAAVQDRLPELLALSLRQPALPAQLYRAILTFLASALGRRDRGEDGRAVLEIICAAYQSARTGQRVVLPFQTEVSRPIALWLGEP